ncbi:cytochrome P450 [Mycena pura]|uniref:Cytochrome P450 n=1 Tax=Mycena pura TaxID=153505 RepID=A0AAD6V3W0_9AGAR|nr:cytochrome P450 [Mycena pura]
MPKTHEWKTFAQWAKTYGDCVYVNVLGQPIVILDSFAAANDLLKQRSAIYSSRPRLVTGFTQSMALSPYSARFLSFRRLIHKELSGNSLQKYWPLHEDESRLLIKKVLLDPSLLLDSIRNYAGSVILRVMYGYQTASEDDKFVVMAEKLLAAFSIGSQPRVWLVDILPWLRHLPSWFPGTEFKRTAARWRQLQMEVAEVPFNWTVANKDSPDMIRPNFVTTILSQSPDVLPEEDRQHLIWAATSLFGGGTDTTVSAISSFFLAMAMYPEVQSRAQAEVDKVVTGGRLPRLSDRPNLPYVECVMQEVLRWNPVEPLGIPHMSTKDDVYRDYHLPAGTIIIANIWSILHDPIVFPDPHEFRPERFLNDKRAVEVNTSAFGFGRRSCPGVYFAEASMFIAICTALSQCNISNPTNSRGQKIGKDVEYQTGTVSHPQEFSCNITPRAGTSGE